jgi:hypothetical protein
MSQSRRLLGPVAGALLSSGVFAAAALGGDAAVAGGGWAAIFNGRDLEGWAGDRAYWRVEGGALVGEITPDRLLEQNSWLIWLGGEVADFELCCDYWVSARGNSGIGYRCEELPVPAHAVRGSQFDIDGGDRWTGQNYEERGRTFLAYRGQSVVLDPGCRPRVTSLLGDRDALQRECVKKEDWNAVRIVARGPWLRHFINDRLVSEVWDNDAAARRLRGRIGVQVHVGPPMVIKYRNLRLRHLPPAPTYRNPLGQPPLAVPDPHVVRHQGRYLMTYSANHTFEEFYGVGVATADHPLGPWTKDPGNPLLTSDPARGVSSPGHNGVAWSPDGRELLLVYHTHLDPDNPGGQRVVNLDRLYFDPSGRLRVTGPTREPQFLPAGTWEP